jgi:hypothetical protein
LYDTYLFTGSNPSQYLTLGNAIEQQNEVQKYQYGSMRYTSHQIESDCYNLFATPPFWPNSDLLLLFTE